MRITDILHQTDSLINLIESFDFSPDDIKWEGDIGYFSIGGERFGATVTPAKPSDEETYRLFFDPIPKVGNVDFWMETPDGKTQDATGLMRSSAFKVFASVALIIKELKERRGYQVLICAAKRSESPTNYSSRVRAYGTIADRIARIFKMHQMQLIDSPTANVWAIFDSKFGGGLYSGMVKVRDHIQEYLDR